MNPFSDDELRQLGELGHQVRQMCKARSKAASKQLGLRLTDEQHRLIVDWITYKISGYRPAKQHQQGPKFYAQVSR